MMLQNTIAELAPVIAHRGASGHAPENTLAAISAAAGFGAQCIEIDVSISADQIPYVHHDDTLDRCTSGTGLLCEQTADQLDDLDASKLMPQFSPEPLPRLSAVIALLDEKNLGLNLEIKPRKGLESATVDAIAAELEKSWPQRLPLVFSSFNTLALEIALQRISWVDRALLVGKLPADWQQQVSAYQCANLHLAASHITADQVSNLKQSGLGLYAYTVNDSTEATKLLQWGIDGVFTDFPDRMLNRYPA
ncbi:MAG: hypothetical protein KTR32_12750 [Granulosicoccus sp.]|nr:hypothetical protein [Granulosicoccus sp.]